MMTYESETLISTVDTEGLFREIPGHRQWRTLCMR